LTDDLARDGQALIDEELGQLPFDVELSEERLSALEDQHQKTLGTIEKQRRDLGARFRRTGVSTPPVVQSQRRPRLMIRAIPFSNVTISFAGAVRTFVRRKATSAAWPEGS
jgi:hypothetical protein